MTATLAVSKLGKKRIAELGAFGRQAVEHAQPTANRDWFKLSLPIESYEHAARTLASIGPEFRVEGPKELRLKLRELAKQLATSCAPALHKPAKRGKTPPKDSTL